MGRVAAAIIGLSFATMDFHPVFPSQPRLAEIFGWCQRVPTLPNPRRTQYNFYGSKTWPTLPTQRNGHPSSTTKQSSSSLINLFLLVQHPQEVSSDQDDKNLWTNNERMQYTSFSTMSEQFSFCHWDFWCLYWTTTTAFTAPTVCKCLTLFCHNNNDDSNTSTFILFILFSSTKKT